MASSIVQEFYAQRRRKGFGMDYNPVSVPALMALLVMPGPVIWSYGVGAAVLATGLASIFFRRGWQTARGFDRLILFGPLFYGASIAAFGTEHFTVTAGIASIVPPWIPWHLFWTWLVGACFIAAGLSLVTGIQSCLAATLLALTFFLFVVLMDAPAWAQDPRDRFATALMLRELAFSGGPLALAASLIAARRRHRAKILATVARYFVAIPVLYYSFELFVHADHVPAIPLEAVTPAWIPGHSIWTYFTAAVYAVGGPLLLAGRKTRAAATWLGLVVLVSIVAVYVPVAFAERASLDKGLNYLGDTLMFCGDLLLLAGAMPRSSQDAVEVHAPSVPASR